MDWGCASSGGALSRLSSRGGDLPKELLLRIEVVIKGAIGHVGPLGDVRDACVEQPVALEDLLGGLYESSPRLLTFGRARLMVRRPLRVDPGSRQELAPFLVVAGQFPLERGLRAPCTHPLLGDR